MDSSTADRGFFQAPPVLPNQFYDDESFQRCFRLFLPSDIRQQTSGDTAALGQQVLSDVIFSWVTDAERNKPYVKGTGRQVFGQRATELVTSHGWQQLQAFGISKGLVACGYDSPYGPFSRPLQFLRTHLWAPSSANVGCPFAMQDGAAGLLRKHLKTRELASRLSEHQLEVFRDAYNRLTSRDASFAWTSGQWMTERSGGSDVLQTETTAEYRPRIDGESWASKQQQLPLGPWVINGFKWFSSATDCNMTILLAQTPGGLSAFVAPMRKHDATATSMTGVGISQGTCTNGVYVSRLKNKFGTQPLPTAELVLEDMRGWLVGDQGSGIQQVSTVLNLTRIHSAVGAVAGIGRGLAVARAYAKLRDIGAGKGARIRLAKSPLHIKTLADMTAEYHRLMLLSFFATYILGLADHALKDGVAPTLALQALTPEPELVEPLLRVLTQLTKAYVCNSSIPLMFACMESLGGVGYLWNEEQEYLNLSRIFRDICVNPIWEGTTNVLCTDFVRALKHAKSGAASIAALGQVIERASAFEAEGPRPKEWNCLQEWESLKNHVCQTPQTDLMMEAREVVWRVAEILISVLLYVDAGSDGNPAAREMLLRFLQAKFGKEKRDGGDMRDEMKKNLGIVFGHGDSSSKL
ncbi:hypothetical protein CDD82_4991 [Ophiocordyceps australis]|uniref:Acyl-CoA dehydrogenase/oxidase C-terminal domain-containing protein n=1 Tax=Ophiocordyceps australis TaxID=1399860 RepID=A0A2C5ZL72_9HYPO|nr:hypothetical protein CDD82_4991 [Ophiocordyceps australis]